jgi:tRNA dimethylallyltransferase
MDVGTAKPDAATLHKAPHRLIDIRDPEERYSAGDFVRDARAEMEQIFARGRVPLLVGGTMMYFRALTGGIAALPSANAQIRATIDAEAQERGWPAMHQRLLEVDPAAANRIKPHDRQRIQRALEVFIISGKPLSEWQETADISTSDGIHYRKIALQPASRKVLHERIEYRLKVMLNNGFLEEVKELYKRPGLTPEHPSMRSVGYRQLWQHLDGALSLQEAGERALYATRQLAKRQITWLRSETGLNTFDPLEANTIDAISASLIEFFNA